jgi:hypothetical protein
VSTNDNIWEWCATVKEWQAQLKQHNVAIVVKRLWTPLDYDPDVEDDGILFGGSFYSDQADETHLRTRDLPEAEETRHSNLGFRVCVLFEPRATFDIEQNILEYVSTFTSVRLYTPVARGKQFTYRRY